MISYRSCRLLVLSMTLSAGCARETLLALPTEEALPESSQTSTPEQVPGEAQETPDSHSPPEQEPEAPPVVEPEPEPEPIPPPPEDDCAETSELLYTVDKGNGALYLFDPSNGTFRYLGIPDCGPFAGTPTSMAVARNGRAYIRYSSQTLYVIELDSLECTETAMQVSAFGSFGMGYATLHAETWEDELFIANRSTLARLDTTTFSVHPLGGLPSQSELTGNARGELWGVFPLESPAQIMELDRETGIPLQSITLSFMPSPTTIDTFAFATWGGEFFVFLRLYGMGESTQVYRISPTGTTEILSQDTGRNIVGVGVSTCAPTH